MRTFLEKYRLGKDAIYYGLLRARKSVVMSCNCGVLCSGILMDVKRDNRVLSLVNRAGLKGTLSQMLDQLQRCQKSLNEFLEVIANL